MHGGFGYSLTDTLLPEELGQKEALPSVLIWCNIIIKNSSKTTAEQEYFTVYPEPLNVYVSRGRLLTDTLELEITGTESKLNINQIKDDNCRLLSAGTKSGAGEIFVNRSVSIIKHITKGIV
jgi:hypothetical protein